jgi:hypothetical protein
MLSFRNEGTEAAKNVRLQCSAESGWKPILRPEVVASISPGATVRVVDESGQTAAQGQSIAAFVHSLPSREHAMTVTFEDRLGEQRERDFRVAAEENTPIDSLAVTFYPGPLRTDGMRVLKNLLRRARARRDAAEISKILNTPSSSADRGRAGQLEPIVVAQRQQEPRNDHGVKKRGRPTEIPDERKQRALAVRGGKARAQILYATKYPTPQQVKNVSSILKHYRRKSAPKQG